MKFVSFSRKRASAFSREPSDTYCPWESAYLIPLLHVHYRARPNHKLTRETNRSINPGVAEAAQSILSNITLSWLLLSILNNIILERILLYSPRLYMHIGVKN